MRFFKLTGLIHLEDVNNPHGALAEYHGRITSRFLWPIGSQINREVRFMLMGILLATFGW